MVKINDLRAKTVDELETRLTELKKEQINLRIQQSTGQLQNTSNMKKARREVAQIKTLISERKKNS
jgi:large subunit ribosomal protein L29